MKSSKGIKKGTRHKFSRGRRESLTVDRLMKGFKPGQRVILTIAPSSHRGFPPQRYTGLSGEIEELRGSSCVVLVRTGRKEKRFIVHPEHLKTVGGI